jgi:predicted RNA-binding Zn-ribbon protein involved in translation (DUF1610 family)
MNCANCGSSDFVRLALLQQRGTTHTYSSGFVVGTVGEAYVHASSTSQTASALMAAPPEEKSNWIWMGIWLFYVPMCAIAGIGGIIATPWVGPESLFFATSALIVVGLVHFWVRQNLRRIGRYNAEVFQPLLQEWRNSYQCQRCGFVGKQGTSAKQILNVTERALEG